MDCRGGTYGLACQRGHVPCEPCVPEALRGRVFRGTLVVRRGLLTPDQLRSKAWRRVRRDVYADARLSYDHGLTTAAVALTLPKGGLIGGRSAAWLFGVHQASPEDPVDVVLPAEFSWWSQQGVSVHVQCVPPADVTKLGHRRATTPSRTGIDIARWYDAVVAVPIIDAMLASRITTEPALRQQLKQATGHGIGHARRALTLCDGRAESPPESVLRVRLMLAGLPAPVPQYEVWRDGRFVARVDLGWPEVKVAVEYDGAWHGAPGQLGRDRRRLNALVAAGWTVIHVTAADLRILDGIIAQLRSLLLKTA